MKGVLAKTLSILQSHPEQTDGIKYCGKTLVKDIVFEILARADT